MYWKSLASAMGAHQVYPPRNVWTPDCSICCIVVLKAVLCCTCTVLLNTSIVSPFCFSVVVVCSQLTVLYCTCTCKILLVHHSQFHFLSEHGRCAPGMRVRLSVRACCMLWHLAPLNQSKVGSCQNGQFDFFVLDPWWHLMYSARHYTTPQ